MKITDIRLQGFRSFHAEQSVSVPDGAGLVFVGGKNEVEPRLGSNGVGKSSLGEALVWCFFGVSSSGLKSTVLHARDCEFPMAVTVLFERNDVKYTLERTHKPNALLLDSGSGPVTVQQSVVDDIIGVPLSTFTHSVFFGQNNQGYFADLKSAEALGLLTDVLDLSKWDESSNNAKEAATAAQEAVRALEKTFDEATISVSHHKDAAKDAKNALAQLLAIKGRARDDMEAAIAVIDKKNHKLEAQSDKARSARRKQQKAYKDMEAEFLDTNAALTKLQRAHTRAAQELKSLRVAHKAASARGRDHAATTSCPMCAQDLPKKAHKEMLSSLKAECESIKGNGVAAKKRAEQAEKAANKAADVAGKVQAAMSKQQKAYGDSDNILSEITGEIRSGERAKQALSDQAPTVTDDDIEAAEGTIKKHKGKASESKKQKKAAERELSKAKNQHEITVFWQKEFKRIRFWVLEKALLELSTHTENSLRELGLAGWRINYEVDLESARPVFRASIECPTIEGSLPWGSYSGGESQRLRIAAEIAFCELVRTRAGFFPNIEFWDEPTPHLSSDGVTDLMAYMKERSKEYGLQVWVVDHRMPASAAFDSELLITKTSKGSTIQLKF